MSESTVNIEASLNKPETEVKMVAEEAKPELSKEEIFQRLEQLKKQLETVNDKDGIERVAREIPVLEKQVARRSKERLCGKTGATAAKAAEQPEEEAVYEEDLSDPIDRAFIAALLSGTWPKIPTKEQTDQILKDDPYYGKLVKERKRFMAAGLKGNGISKQS